MTRRSKAKSLAVALLLDAGRSGIRTFGKATADLRPNPDFLLIGAKRGGSTSFYFDLLRHPQVAPLFPRPDRLPKAAATKGIHFFDSNYFRGMRWYRSHLPSSRVRRLQERTADGPVVVGEGSPYYLTNPFAPQRAADQLPDVKILAVLRDPVIRAYSHWKERVREGREDLSFGDALEAESARVGDDAALLADPRFVSYAHEHQSYLEQSRYGVALSRWFACYPKSSFHLVRSEDYYADPSGALDGAALFLGIAPGEFAAGAAMNAAPGEDLDPGLRREVQELLRPDATLLRDTTGITWEWV